MDNQMDLSACAVHELPVQVKESGAISTDSSFEEDSDDVPVQANILPPTNGWESGDMGTSSEAWSCRYR